MADGADDRVGAYRRVGHQCLLRYRRLGRPSWVFPVTVVEDGPDLAALYLRPGTPTRRRVLPDGTPIPRELPYEQRAALPHVMGEGAWTTHHALILVRPGDAHDVRLFWSERWEFRGWYVNLQAPVRRTALGFDSVDHVVDIVVDPDGLWSWKDEEEFASAQRIGRFSADEAKAIRREGERVIERIDSRRWPFDGSWIHWRPDPDWPIPDVPDSWDR